MVSVGIENCILLFYSSFFFSFSFVIVCIYHTKCLCACRTKLYCLYNTVTQIYYDHRS